MEFVAMLKQHDHGGAAAKYNSEDIVSYEAMDGPMSVARGKAAVKQKADWWEANHEVHGGTTEGPFMNGDQFAVIFELDVTSKQDGRRMQMKEVGLYTMKDGKIIEERFFYTM